MKDRHRPTEKPPHVEALPDANTHEAPRGSSKVTRAGDKPGAHDLAQLHELAILTARHPS